MSTITLTDYCTVDDVKVRIARVESILTALENAMLDGTMDLGREGFSFDDGQTKIQTNFKSLDQISKAYEHWLKVHGLLMLRCDGGIFTARNMNYRSQW